MAVFIFMAGHETTASGIASGVLALLQHLEQLAALRADVDGKVEGAVEETLRYESPVPRAARLAREEMEDRWRPDPSRSDGRPTPRRCES